jgi:hypothetical protein
LLGFSCQCSDRNATIAAFGAEKNAPLGRSLDVTSFTAPGTVKQTESDNLYSHRSGGRTSRLDYAVRYYPEKKAAEHFLTALMAGDTRQAPVVEIFESYKYGDFMADWGADATTAR